MFRQTEGGVGVAETIAASSAAGCTVKQAGLREKAFDQGTAETRSGFSRTGGEYEIIRLGCLADCFDSFKIGSGVLRGDKLPEFSFTAHIDTDERTVLLVGADVDVAPAKIRGLHRPHARIGHDQHEVVGHVAVPSTPIVLRILDPATREGMQMAVLLRRKFLPPRLVREELALGHLPFADVLLVGREIQDGAEGHHFLTNRAVFCY